MTLTDQHIGILYPRYLKYSENRDDAIIKLAKDIWRDIYNKDFLEYVTNTVNKKFPN